MKPAMPAGPAAPTAVKSAPTVDVRVCDLRLLSSNYGSNFKNDYFNYYNDFYGQTAGQYVDVTGLYVILRLGDKVYRTDCLKEEEDEEEEDAFLNSTSSMNVGKKSKTEGEPLTATSTPRISAAAPAPVLPSLNHGGEEEEEAELLDGEEYVEVDESVLGEWDEHFTFYVHESAMDERAQRQKSVQKKRTRSRAIGRRLPSVVSGSTPNTPRLGVERSPLSSSVRPNSGSAAPGKGAAGGDPTILLSTMEVELWRSTAASENLIGRFSFCLPIEYYLFSMKQQKHAHDMLGGSVDTAGGDNTHTSFYDLKDGIIDKVVQLSTPSMYETAKYGIRLRVKATGLEQLIALSNIATGADAMATQLPSAGGYNMAAINSNNSNTGGILQAGLLGSLLGAGGGGMRADGAGGMAGLFSTPPMQQGNNNNNTPMSSLLGSFLQPGVPSAGGAMPMANFGSSLGGGNSSGLASGGGSGGQSMLTNSGILQQLMSMQQNSTSGPGASGFLNNAADRWQVTTGMSFENNNNNASILSDHNSYNSPYTAANIGSYSSNSSGANPSSTLHPMLASLLQAQGVVPGGGDSSNNNSGAQNGGGLFNRNDFGSGSSILPTPSVLGASQGNPNARTDGK